MKWAGLDKQADSPNVRSVIIIHSSVRSNYFCIGDGIDRQGEKFASQGKVRLRWNEIFPFKCDLACQLD